jgi:hypothetical protein
MSFSQRVREIQTLLLSFHPVLVIETVEEERVRVLLQTATKEMNLPLYEWAIVHGLFRSPGSFEAPWTNEFAPPKYQHCRGRKYREAPSALVAYPGYEYGWGILAQGFWSPFGWGRDYSPVAGTD